ncbi:MAG: homocysteine S-methyltransferase family protein [Victivallaceae bacterium]|nr:homocysteine S-methyltransferase family protein [Victivallaceae bacterium]
MLEGFDKRLLVFDGGMGTMIQKAKAPMVRFPEELNVDCPELISQIHESYLAAGADIVSCNTFGCNRLRMAECRHDVRLLVESAVKNARNAVRKCKKSTAVALDIGPIGRMLQPIGTLPFDEACDVFSEIISIAADDVDVVLLETMTDLYELKAAILAAKEHSNLPVFASMTFEKNGRTMTGTDVRTFVNVAEGLGVDAIGVNCSLGPVEIEPMVNELLASATVPVLVQPNAGIPEIRDGTTVFPVGPDEFASAMAAFAKSGIAVAGGCCGTTPEHIAAMKRMLPRNVAKRHVVAPAAVSSGTKTVVFGGRPVVCGERINPTGKKKMQSALREGRLDYLVAEAIRQDEAGADVLDVNVGLPGIDEAETLRKVIPMLQEVVDLPLQIDSSDPKAVEAACRCYNGRPIINSVNGKQSSMNAILPIAAKYGAIVIALALDDSVPETAEERLAIVDRIVAKAAEFGIPESRIVVDCLTLTASAQQSAVRETLKALRSVSKRGMLTALGVSNVSFGLPNRQLLNRTFLAMALEDGLDMPIINPLDTQMTGTVDAFAVLDGSDSGATVYIGRHADDATTTTTTATKTVQPTLETDDTLEQAIYRGLADKARLLAQAELAGREPLDVVDRTVIPTLDSVGHDYESGKLFLPQLLRSAEAAKAAFEVIQTKLPSASAAKGPVMICTVEGDIHDIGKNIVKVVLQSYGYGVIDLGKDVKAEDVVGAWRKYAPKVVGLSALMTTTVPNMEKTISLLKKAGCFAPIWVGGAVLTEETADAIGADHYTKDAMSAVRLLDGLGIF